MEVQTDTGVCPFRCDFWAKDDDGEQDSLVHAEVTHLRAEIARMTQEIASLQENCVDMRRQAAEYRMDWINEYRSKYYANEGTTSFSQARWEDPTPDEIDGY